MLATLFSTLALAGLSAAAPIKTHTFAKRFSGDATYYATGLGACGGTNSDSDFIVALNAPQYGDGYPGPNCGKQVTISYGGKTATATIVDKCPGCAYGALDMSPSLFEHFAPHSVGRFQMSWEFSGGGGGGGEAPAPAPSPSKEEPKPTPTPSPEPEPTPTSSEAPPPPPPSSSSEAPPPSSSESATPSSTVAPSSSAISSSASANSTTLAPSSSANMTSSSASANATNTIPVITNPDSTAEPAGEAGNIGNLTNLISYLGRLAITGVTA